MADSQIEEIKNRLNILDVVGSYIKLTKTGINYRGVCPFHSEKKPSFFVNPSRQLFHCFGCGAGFSIFDFVMKIEGVEFGDALRILAAKAGVELKRENPQLRTERQRLYEICELATKFFEKQLEASAVGKEAEDYLLKRGLTKDSVKKWRIGYSPDMWQGLSDFVVGQGYQREEVVKAGLAIVKEGGGGSYDRFRGRIMFPIFDLNGQTVGFGGRVFKQQDETAKYINTHQTLLYDKSGIMYGLNNAKLAVRKHNQCVVTEGYTDVIMCHQAGYENTVAASGTALTDRHLGIIKRYTENLVLAFDMDVAGDSATKRGINAAESLGFNIKVIEHYGESDKKSDPAEIILKDPKIWEESVAKAKSIMDYYFDSACAAFDKNTPQGKKEIGRIVLPPIKRLPNKIEQAHWVQKLAGLLQMKEEVIMEELAKVPSTKNYGSLDAPAALPKSIEEAPVGQRKKLIEERIISLVLKNPSNMQGIQEEHWPLLSEQYRTFLQELKKNTEHYQPGQEEALKNHFNKIFSAGGGSPPKADAPQEHAFGGHPDEQFKNFLAALALKSEMEGEEDEENELNLCLLQLKHIELKNRLEALSGEIKKAEIEKNSQKVKELLEEFNTMSKELQ